MRADSETPNYVKSIATIAGHKDAVRALAWSRSGRLLASSDAGGEFNVWEIVKGQPRLRLKRRLNGQTSSLSWSYDDRYLACGSPRAGVEIWDILRGEQVWPGLHGKHTEDARCVAWAPYDLRMAFGGASGTVCFRDFRTGWERPVDQFGIGHAYRLETMVWSPRGDTLVTGTQGGTIGLWSDSDVDNQLRHGLSMDGAFAHDEETLALAWSGLGDTLASSSRDGRVCLWNMRDRSLAESLTFADIPLALEFALNGRILVLRCLDHIRFVRCDPLTEIAAYRIDGSLDPHRSSLTLDRSSRLATADSSTNAIVVLNVDFVGLLRFSEITNRFYRAAAVSIFGESASGRTNLVSALTNRPFTVAAVPHSLETHTLRLPLLESPKGEEIRDIAFWDVPSNPGSLNDGALLQRIHAGESQVTLLVLDVATAGEAVHDPKARAATRRLYEGISLTTRPILVVVSRCDRLEHWPDQAELTSIAEALGVGRVFATSAKTGQGIDDIKEAILQAIDWSAASCAESEEIFRHVRSFVDDERNRGRILIQTQDLHDGFVRSHEFLDHRSPTASQFSTAIALLETLGEVNTFDAQNVVLIRPAYFHTYATAMIAGARTDAKGMGRLPIKDARRGHGRQFSVPEDARISDVKEERRVLSVTIDELLARKVAQEVSTNSNNYLVFPRSVDRQWDGGARLPERVASCRYQGAVEEVFSSLIVRFLSLGNFYPESNLWKDAAKFKALSGGTCGFLLLHDETADEGEISVFFEDRPDNTTRQTFCQEIRDHLETEGKNVRWESSGVGSSGNDLVFFCHRLDREDAVSVKVIADKMAQRAISVWLEERDAHAGEAGRMRSIQLETSSVAVVFLNGPISTRLKKDCEVLVRRGCAIVPVILPTTPKQFRMPELLGRFNPVDFRQLDPDPIDRLVNGISEIWRRGTPSAAARVGKRHVFVSYARGDLSLVEPLVEGIAKHHDVWWDQQIEGGADWRLAIQTAMEESYAVVICFSDRTADISGVNPEILMAIEMFQKLPPHWTFLIPIRLAPCEIPTFSLGAGRTLRDLEHIDCFAHPPERSVLEAVRRALDRARTPESRG